MKRVYFYSIATYKNGAIHRVIYGDMEISGEGSVGLTKLVTDEALNRLSPLEEGEVIHLNALNQI